MPYSKFNQSEMILRDYLAQDRTKLANERTFLAYLRTAITFSAAGGTLIKIFTSYFRSCPTYSRFLFGDFGGMAFCGCYQKTK